MFPIKTSTYSHGDDLIFKHGLSLEIDSRPLSKDSMIIAKTIWNHELHIKAISKKIISTTYLMINPSLSQIKLLANDWNKAWI